MKYALRTLWHDRGFAAMAVLGMLGGGGGTARRCAGLASAARDCSGPTQRRSSFFGGYVTAGTNMRGSSTFTSMMAGRPSLET